MRNVHFRFALAAACLATVAAQAAEPLPADRAHQLRMIGQSEKAKHVLEQALTVNDGDDLTWYELSRTEFYHMRFDEAAAAIERAIELEPGAACYHHMAGVTAAYNAVLLAKAPDNQQRVQAEMGKSLRAFRAAVEADPEHHEARLQLINMLIQAPPESGGDREEAERHAAKLKELDPVYGAQAEQMLAQSESDLTRLARWNNVVQAHPKRAEAHVGLAEALIANEKYALAEAKIRRAVQLDAQTGTAYFSLARAHIMQKDHAAARDAVQAYLEDVPGAPRPLRAYATFLLAALERQAGNQEQAEGLLTEAKELDPHCWTTFREPPAVLFENL